MRITEILQDLFFIERGYLNGNHFAYRGPEPVLIDTAYRKDFSDTREALESAGIELAQAGLIVNTHCHCDHVGGNKIIQELSGCNIAMHPIGRHFIETRNDWATWWRYYRQDADFFACTQSLANETELHIGPHVFSVLHTPGHATDGLVLYNARERLLISSDTLWEHDMAVITERVEGSGAVFAMLHSLDTIAALDVDLVYPGHGRPFRDMHAAIERAVSRLRGFLENRNRMGNDLIKKIVVYTLMMRERMEEATFFDYLMHTPWFPETVDLYFSGDYRDKYETILTGLLDRGLVKRHGPHLVTTVKP